MAFTPSTAINWLNVVALLVQTGVVAEGAIASIIKSHRGLTDLDTLPQDDADLLALKDKIAAIRAAALAESLRTS